MATLSAVIVPAKMLKNGKHKIRISVSHNGETRYIVTNILLNSIKEFKNGMIVKRADAAILNTKLRGILQQYQAEIEQVQYINGLTCSELVFQIKNANNKVHRTLKSVYEEYMSNANIKPNSVKCYSLIWNVMSNHLKEKLFVENITYTTILEFDKYLRKRGLKPTTIKNYMTFFSILINYAKKCGYVQFRIEPMAAYEMPKPEIREAWLSTKEIKSIRDYKTTNKRYALCRDLFMLSYYLGGINIVDLLKINFNENKSKICYIRTKTENKSKINKYVEFDIPDEAKPLIKLLTGKDGRINVTKDQRKTSLHSLFSYSMPRLGAEIGIKKLIYYSARKSFSQHAFDLGVNTSVIDYILGHKIDKGATSLYAYIKVTPEMATNAIRKVLDNLK